MWLTGKLYHGIIKMSIIMDSRQRGEEVGKNTLRGEMAKYKVTVSDLAGELGVSANTVSKKLNGKVDFTLSEIRKILAFFNAKGENHTVETLFDI